MNGRVRGPDRQVGAASSRPQLNWNFETDTLNFGLLNFQLTYEMRSGSIRLSTTFPLTTLT